MLFGKVNENNYNMDIGLPLSPLIAFGVALSSFDEKFFCEWKQNKFFQNKKITLVYDFYIINFCGQSIYMFLSIVILNLM